jgi:hypothetical protein
MRISHIMMQMDKIMIFLRQQNIIFGSNLNDLFLKIVGFGVKKRSTSFKMTQHHVKQSFIYHTSALL